LAFCTRLNGPHNGQVRCFSLFFQEITASAAAFAAEILDFRRFGARKNSKPPAVPSLFALFFENKNGNNFSNVGTRL